MPLPFLLLLPRLLLMRVSAGIRCEFSRVCIATRLFRRGSLVLTSCSTGRFDSQIASDVKDEQRSLILLLHSALNSRNDRIVGHNISRFPKITAWVLVRSVIFQTYDSVKVGKPKVPSEKIFFAMRRMRATSCGKVIRILN